VYCTDTVLDCNVEQVKLITRESLGRVAAEQAEARPDNRKSKKRAPSAKRITPSKDTQIGTMDKEGS